MEYLRRPWPIDRQEVTNDGFVRTNVVGQNLSLHVCIGVGNPLVLAEVLSPGVHHEPLDDLFRIGGIFRHTPPIGTIAAAFLRQVVESTQEG